MQERVLHSSPCMRWLICIEGFRLYMSANCKRACNLVITMCCKLSEECMFDNWGLQKQAVQVSPQHCDVLFIEAEQLCK